MTQHRENVIGPVQQVVRMKDGNADLVYRAAASILLQLDLRET